MATLTIAIGKIGSTVNVDVEALPPKSLEYVIRYGLTQALNDAHSQVTATAEPDADKRAALVREAVDKKLAALMSGDIRVARSGGGRTADPIQREINRLARAFVEARIAAKVAAGALPKGTKPEDIGNFAELVKAEAVHATRGAGYRAQAEAIVAARNVEDDLDFELAVDADDDADHESNDAYDAE